jgi:Flavodoxin domain
MRTLVLYESMYGNTHVIAEAIAAVIRPSGEVQVMPAGEATGELVAWADLLIVGGPTHARGMPSPASRASARETAAKPEAAKGWDLELTLDPAAEGPGVREWLAALGPGEGKLAAAFDTRVHGPAIFTGRASSAIAQGLRGHGFRLIADPESFLVDTHNRLSTGERERATGWAARLVADLVPASPMG